MVQFVVNSTSVENIISSIKEGEIAIPEIQRPFVWDGSKVRDLMDSLYNGFPVGYIIIYTNHNTFMVLQFFYIQLVLSNALTACQQLPTFPRPHQKKQAY